MYKHRNSHYSVATQHTNYLHIMYMTLYIVSDLEIQYRGKCVQGLYILQMRLEYLRTSLSESPGRTSPGY